ncbi:thiamin-phosphate pyrophosphorylase [Geofilum rubicundum JCM 15548]|uniref:Thiamine-phosphate synthase n=2 Tax=Geofilum TaxID=1236988 RepID=A0A0E9M1M5_9BACT|nr:thiamin-phosphate pyrophosphorylase [Geofilum rubicundum JCM 15548]
MMYITPNRTAAEVERLVLAFLEGGGRWVQLRLKDVSEASVYERAKKVQGLCRQHDAIFIVNDYPEIALQLGADGVHLGKLDMPVEEARMLFGPEKIIGGTANTLEDMIRLSKSGVDYLGLGPFRYTTTKKNLSPVLGLAGYRTLLHQFRSLEFHTPVTAIGGILLEDVADILATGVDGIAVSGVLSRSGNAGAATEAFLALLLKRKVDVGE